MAIEKMNIGVGVVGQSTPGWNNRTPKTKKDLTQVQRKKRPEEYRRSQGEQFPPERQGK